MSHSEDCLRGLIESNGWCWKDYSNMYDMLIFGELVIDYIAVDDELYKRYKAFIEENDLSREDLLCICDVLAGHK